MTANAFGALAIVNILDARSLLTAFGVAGIFVALFAETGLLVGFFLPGDSLLFTAGLLSSTRSPRPCRCRGCWSRPSRVPCWARRSDS